MFTGIIEALGEVKAVRPKRGNVMLSVSSPISHNLTVDQSVSHNGVCLTVIEVTDHIHVVTAVEETLKKSNLGKLNQGDTVNLERAMTVGDRFDGHIVLGHTDQVGECTRIMESNGSWHFEFSYEPGDMSLVVGKGSVCINGVSLTVVNAGRNNFSAALIPYTFENTNFRYLKEGDAVNLEFDIVGKYVAGWMGIRNARS